LRQLVWMSDGLLENQWSHTASILALIANVNRDPKKHKALKPDDLNPTVQKEEDAVEMPQSDLTELREFFTGRK